MQKCNNEDPCSAGVGGVAFDHGRFPKIVAIHSVKRTKKQQSPSPSQCNDYETTAMNVAAGYGRSEASKFNSPPQAFKAAMDVSVSENYNDMKLKAYLSDTSQIDTSKSTEHIKNRAVNDNSSFTMHYHARNDLPELLPITANLQSAGKRTTPVGFPLKKVYYDEPPLLQRNPSNFQNTQHSSPFMPYPRFEALSIYPPHHFTYRPFFNRQTLQQFHFPDCFAQYHRPPPYQFQFENIHQADLYHNYQHLHNDSNNSYFDTNKAIGRDVLDNGEKIRIMQAQRDQNLIMEEFPGNNISEKQDRKTWRILGKDDRPRQRKPYKRDQKSSDFSHLLKLENKYELTFVLKSASEQSRENLYYVVNKCLEDDKIQNSLFLLENLKHSDLTELTKEKILSVTEEIIWKTPPRYELWEKQELVRGDIYAEKKKENSTQSELDYQICNSINHVDEHQIVTNAISNPILNCCPEIENRSVSQLKLILDAQQDREGKITESNKQSRKLSPGKEIVNEVGSLALEQEKTTCYSEYSSADKSPMPFAKKKHFDKEVEIIDKGDDLDEGIPDGSKKGSDKSTAELQHEIALSDEEVLKSNAPQKIDCQSNPKNCGEKLNQQIFITTKNDMEFKQNNNTSRNVFDLFVQ